MSRPFSELSPIPHPDQPDPDLVNAIANIRGRRDELASMDEELTRVLGLELSPLDKLRQWASEFVILPKSLRDRLAQDPLTLMEAAVTKSLHYTYQDLHALWQVGQDRLNDHNQLVELLEGVKAGDVSLTYVTQRLHDQVRRQAGVHLPPLLQQAIEQTLADTPEEVVCQHQQRVLSTLETIAATTEPIVTIIEQSFRAGITVLQDLELTLHLLTQVGPAIRVIKTTSTDLTDASLANLQTPELLKVQTARAVAALETALEAAQLNQDFSSANQINLVDHLTAQAEALKRKVNQLLSGDNPPQLSDGSQT